MDLSYRGWRAVLDVDAERHVLRGVVLGLFPEVSFEAATLDELTRAFHDAVDAHLSHASPREPRRSTKRSNGSRSGPSADLLANVLFEDPDHPFILLHVEATVDERRSRAAASIRVAAVNGAFTRTTHVAAREAVGRPPEALVSSRPPMGLTGEGAAVLADTCRRCLASGRLTEGEVQMLRDGGTTIWRIRLRPLKDAAGRVHSLLGRMLEGTEQVMDQRALAQAQEEVRDAQRAKQAFLATVSHELRTPLNAIVGFADLLASFELPEEASEFVGYINVSGRKLHHLIGEVLDFARLEAQQFTLTEEVVHLPRIVEEVMESMASSAARKGVELAYRVEPSVPAEVLGDPFRLHQVLTNLVANALRFTPAGEVEVHVHADRLANAEYEIHVSVRDTGIGIPAAEQQEIFKPFYQVDASDAREYGGAGLGLALCRRLAALMGGGVWVESEVERGSTFHFTAVLAGRAQPEAARVNTEEVDLANRSVLVVDDVDVNRRLVRLALEDWGMVVSEARSGSEALDHLEREHVDVLLLDVQMPGMDGLTLARRIRARYPDEALPIVLLTSVDVPAHEARGLVQATLTKPVIFSRLRRALEPLVPSTPSPDLAGRADVLVVEDQPTSLRVAQAMLRRLGLSSDVARDGLAAVEALRHTAYDLVFMDIEMPHLDGVEATRRIRAAHGDAHGEAPYIVALTGHVLPGDLDQYLRVGMNDYLRKPLRIADLYAVLDRYRARTNPSD